jgi:cold shock protein
MSEKLAAQNVKAEVYYFMKSGTIKHWDASKGFGFITTDDDEDVFLHVSNLSPSLDAQQITAGMRVKFDIKSDLKGDKAVNVKKA